MGYDTREIDHPAVDQFVFWVVGLVIGGIGADDVNDRRIGPAGVVQHGNSVGKPAADMEECDCRRTFHARVSIRRASDDILLQTQDGANIGRKADLVDQLHFGSTRVCKAVRDTGIRKSFEESLGTVHSKTSWSWPDWL